MTIVFALLLCGVVSAEDSQEVSGVENNTFNSSTENSSALIDPEITLNINLEHPEALSEDRLPDVTVTDSDGNNINDITVTKNSDTEYKVNFISDKTSFILTVGALGHVNETVNVIVSKTNPTDPILYGNATVNLRAYNLL
ncbi:MAG: hypothetical protein KO316_06375, partial [Methanobacterium sp.]|nr:hypothetical protein [Methanobacterium sp.]